MSLTYYLILIESKLVKSVLWIKKVIVVKSAGQAHSLTLFITKHLSNLFLGLANARIIYSAVLAHSSLMESIWVFWIDILSLI